MIPVSLVLKGIYSYQKEQTIDFTSLTSNHLFGIFGPVGSGKSTILEAITFALYGETERLNIRDNRGYNMMNLKSSELMIDFIFKAGKNNSEQFRFTVKGIRDKKLFENTKPFERRAFKYLSKTWEPINDVTAENIIGLSYENFRRTIIIPQGKFQEFLQLGDSDRTRMLKEIFNLNKYDLSLKTDQVDKQNTLVLENVKGQLAQIGEVDQSIIDEESNQLLKCTSERKDLDTSLNEQQLIEAELKKLRDIQTRIDTQKEEVNKLQNQAEHFDQRSGALDRYETCQKQFPDIIKQKRETEKGVSVAVKNVETTQKRINDTSISVEKLEKEFQIVKPQFENRHNLEVQWKELESVGAMLQLNNELKSITQNESKINKTIEQLTQTIDKIKIERKSIDQTLKQLKESLPDDTALFEMKRWFDREKVLKERIDELRLNIKEETKAFEEYQKQKNEILKSGILTNYLKPADKKLPIEEMLNLLKGFIKLCRKSSREKDKEIESLRNTQVLETFASELNEGEPCLLCGAKHHPNVYAGKGVKSKINLLTRDKVNLERGIEDLQAIVQDLDKLNTHLENAQKLSSKILKDLDSKKQEYENHEKQFKWKEYSTDDEKRVDREIKLVKGIKESVKKHESRRIDLDKMLNNEENSYNETKEELQLLIQRQSEINGQRKTLVGQIKIFDLRTLAECTEQSLRKEITVLKRQYLDVEEQYKDLDGQIHGKKDNLNSMRGVLKTEDESLIKTREQLKSIDKELTNRIRSANYKDLKQIEDILSSKIDVKTERQAIQTFREKLHSAKEQLKKFIHDKGDAVYNEANHRTIADQIEKLKLKIKELDETIGKVSSRLTTLKKDLKLKAELESNKHHLENRSDNLAILKKLFRGNNFVNYASRVYLENLCGIANQRFIQLTRQKLRLELSEDNSFKVRDYLNDGKLRSVKTLSGGQTFQASLSLALALADNVQRFAQVNENFFFLDEGFGTLDKDALKVVFDALKLLRLENRIVGVISHVEDLQQEIDNFVKVSLNPEIGSIIELS